MSGRIKIRPRVLTARELRWQADAAEVAAMDWSKCLDCGSAEVMPRQSPHSRPLCRACLRVRGERAIRDLYPE